MAIDAVIKVVEAEKQAEEMLNSCSAKAKQIIADATQRGKEDMDTAVSAAQEQVRDLMRKAQLNSSTIAMEITAQAEAECEKLRAIAYGRMDEAVKFIVKKVVVR